MTRAILVAMVLALYAGAAGALSLNTIPGKLSVGKIDASGARSTTTFLRGDGSWQVPPGGGGGVPWDYTLPEDISIVKSTGFGSDTILSSASTGFATLNLLAVDQGSINVISEFIPVDTGGIFFRKWQFGTSSNNVGFTGIGGGTTELKTLLGGGTQSLRLIKGTGDLELGTEIVVRDVDTDTGQRGRPALAQYRADGPKTIPGQICGTTIGFDSANPDECPDPDGVVVFTGHTLSANAPGGQYDPDLSSFGWGSTVNSSKDFLPDADGNGFAVNTAAGTKAAGTSGAFTNWFTDAADSAFCRSTTTPFQSCDTNDSSCTSSLATTEAHPRSVILEDADGNGTGKPRYYPAQLFNYTGCSAESGGVNTASVRYMPFAFNAATDKVWDTSTPGGPLHPSEQYWRWAVQEILELTWEEAFYPRVNMILNGMMDTNCAGWNTTESAGTGLSTTSEPFRPGNATTAGGAVTKNACKFTAGSGSLKVRTDPILIEDGVTYTVRGWVSANHAGTGIRIYAGDGETGLAPALSDGGTVYHKGTDFTYWGKLSASAFVFPTYTQECIHGWCQVIFKFQNLCSPTGSIIIQVEDTVSAGTLVLDNWVMFPDPFDKPSGFTYVLPNAGNISMTIDGDSRNEQLRSAFVNMTRDMANAPIVRPKLALWPVVEDLSETYYSCPVGGFISAYGVGTSPVERLHPELVLYNWGVNDMVVGANQSASNVNKNTRQCGITGAVDYKNSTELKTLRDTYMDRVRKSGSRVVEIFQQRMWGDWDGGTPLTTEAPAEGYICEGVTGQATGGRTSGTVISRTTNCATVQNDYEALILTTPGAVW